MSVSVLERPQGHIICDDGITGIVNEQYGGYASVIDDSHGLVDGDYIYIQSNVESYNGFWYVNAEGSDWFKFRRYATATDQEYIVDATVTYYVICSTHGVSCVHLPITYKLSTDLYPTNSVDSTTTISSFGNDNGYVNLALGGSLDSGAFPEPFESIKITGTTDSELDGIYQIIEVVSPTSYTINLAYDSSYSFGSATVQRCYGNYNIMVKVYGGLNSSHQWTTKRPYELLATLALRPDTNNEVFFSINEILKGQINTRNNLLLDTLPCNIDFFTQFYITYAESYDDSLGSNYTLSTYTSSYTSDQSTFEGMAVNAVLPFKNIHSGNLSDYIIFDPSSKFLTLFDDPVIFENGYKDISFIKDSSADYIVRQQYYLDDVLMSTVNQTVTGDEGVYRVELTENCDYDRVDITLYEDREIAPGSGSVLFAGYEPTVYTGPPT